MRSLTIFGLAAIAASILQSGSAAQAASVDPITECGSFTSFQKGGIYTGTARQVDSAGEPIEGPATDVAIFPPHSPTEKAVLTLLGDRGHLPLSLQYVNAGVLRILRDDVAGGGVDMRTTYTCDDPSRPGIATAIEAKLAVPNANAYIMQFTSEHSRNILG
jgi:hypothetical protein